jgi:hypothetical protein
VNDKRLLMHQMMTQLDDIRTNIGKQSEARQTFLLKDRFTESFYITVQPNLSLIITNSSIKLTAAY